MRGPDAAPQSRLLPRGWGRGVCAGAEGLCAPPPRHDLRIKMTFRHSKTFALFQATRPPKQEVSGAVRIESDRLAPWGHRPSCGG